MASAGTNYSAPSSGRPHRRSALRDYWQRVTEGLAIQQLWGQMKADARATYSFYSHDVDWDAMGTGGKRPFRIAWALFQAMLMKLTPARRVLLDRKSVV